MRLENTHDRQPPQLSARFVRDLCRNLWSAGGHRVLTNSVLGIALVIDTLIDQVIPMSPLAVFWIELWVGLTVASLALWAALYHPAEGIPLPKA